MKSNSKDGIVIAGISGRWPKSRNVHEFMENLLSGEDMIGEVPIGWNASLNTFPSRMGRLGEVDKFDAEYFQKSPSAAHIMDPRIRILLELTHEAIMDSGINPVSLRGSKTGVFVGAAGEDSRTFLRTSSDNPNLLFGTLLSMLPNQVSFAFDFHGPSFIMETGCSSSLVALHEAILNIRSGHCDAAIVAGVNVLLDSDMSKRFHGLSMLSKDGNCKAFDISANGYVRSEAAVVVFICKESFAKRSYAKVLHAKVSTDGSKVQGIFFPSGPDQEQLLREVYAEAGVDPDNVSYIEAHGTGTLAGDPQEVNAIDRFFCTDRHSGPLLIGSVKSNMGHSETASGLCGVAKVILAAQHGMIPGNRHFNQANPEIQGITAGRIKVVDQNTPWKGGIVGVSSFGFGGSNSHVILDVSISENKTASSTIPWLIPFSATTANAVEFALSTVRDTERIGLLQLIQNTNIPGHRFRGYCIPEVCQMKIEELNSTNVAMETWFVFSGLGSQWDGMGRDLLVFKAFRDVFVKAADTVKLFGIDLLRYIVDSATFKASNILYHAVCTCSVEIALVELLSSIDIAPHQIFGHSVGEFACAYADGCFSIEESVLTTWAILKGCLDSNLPPGAMASVGLRWDDKKMPWKDNTPACYNAIDNMMVGGSAASIKELVKYLKGAGIFAREINSQEFAFHSDLMKPAEAQMIENIRGLNLPPKTRSPKWISTSQSSDDIKLLSGSYFVNNILSPVLFHSAVERIPSHVVVIEIAPHGLFQTILKSSLHETCVSISLTDRNQNSAPFFLRSVGKLFVSGLQPKINQLYPKLEFPIRSAALPVSLLIQWDRKDTWIVADMPTSGAGNVIEINLKNTAHQFYKGYKINDQNLFPPSGFLILIWRILAAKGGSSWDEAITFDNIVFNRVCLISVNNISKFICNIHKNGGFEILENGNSVVTGSVKLGDTEMFETEAQISDNDKVYTQAEVYDRFKETGYEFSGTFHSLQEVEIRSHWARTVWQENWFELLESLFQLEMFSNLSTQTLLPVRIAKVTIDEWLLNNIVDPGTPTDVILHRDKNLELVSCAGVQIRGLQLLPLKYIRGISDDSCNLKTISPDQSLPSLLIYFKKQLEGQNIRARQVVIDSNFIELENRLTGTTSGNNNARKICVEFSGLLFDDHKVMGLARFEATTAQLISVVYWAVPDTWSLPQAATVPVAYATAYYALIIRGTLKPYESILIHCGDEAVGEAAIAIALSMKCTVFTTIRAEENKLTLLKRFPELNGAKILSAGHCHNLEKIIHKETKGLGVNVVLNSLPDNLMRMSAHCIAQYGRFLQLMDGGFENPHNRKYHETTLGLSLFMKNVTFHGIRNVLIRSKEEDCKSVYDKVQVGIEMGIVKPLTVTHYEHAQLKEANWFLSRPPGFEKIILEME